MIRKDDIWNIIREYPGGNDFFVVDIRISSVNRISVFVDRMAGISIDECARISRFIERHLDREKEDFELIVSSPGLEAPFKVLEQYRKNINKTIKVQLTNGETHKGKLLGVENDMITLEEKGKKKPAVRAPGKGNKNKQIIIKKADYFLAKIKSAKLSIEIK